jgi:hypothetical protein
MQDAEWLADCPLDLSIPALKMFLERNPDWVPIFDDSGIPVGAINPLFGVYENPLFGAE